MQHTPIGFNICVDDDVAQEQEQQKNDIKKSAWQRGANSTTSLRRRLEGPGRTAEEREARDLFNDPLKNFHASAFSMQFIRSASVMSGGHTSAIKATRGDLPR